MTTTIQNSLRITNYANSAYHTTLEEVRAMCPNLSNKPLEAAYNLLMKEAGELEYEKGLGFYAHKTLNDNRSVGSGFFHLSKEGVRAFNLLWIHACGPRQLTERSRREAIEWMGLHC